MRCYPHYVACALLGGLVSAAQASPVQGPWAGPAGMTPTGDFYAVAGMARADGDPTLCGSRTTLVVEVGDAVNFCYQVYNGTPYTNGLHTLNDSLYGDLFTQLPLIFPSDSVYQYNHIARAEETAFHDWSWLAQFGEEKYGAGGQIRLVVNGQPTIQATPTAIVANGSSGQDVDVVLRIANEGNQILRWELNEATPQAATTGGTALPLGSSAPTMTLPVPAYAFGGWDLTSFTSLDVREPSILIDLVNPRPGNMLAATFIGDDFSKIYAVTSAGGGGSFAIPPNTLVTMPTREDAFGLYETIGTLDAPPGADRWQSMKWDAASGQVYLLNRNTLYTIDPATAHVSLVGTIGGGIPASDEIVAMTIASDGQMYGIDWTNDTLVAIDKTSGAAQVVGPLGVNASMHQGAMDFDPSTHLLYWAGFTVDAQGEMRSTIYTIDTDTGQATVHADLNSNTLALSTLSLAVPQSACGASAPFDRVTPAVSSGSVAVGAPAQDVTLTVHTRGLASGTYTSELCLRSNDRQARSIAIPITVTVTDALFADGFEAAP
jgi:hypothetical protein